MFQSAGQSVTLESLIDGIVVEHLGGEDEVDYLFANGRMWTFHLGTQVILVKDPEDAILARLVIAKHEAKTKVADHASQIRRTIAYTDDPIELAGWPNKASRARRVLSDPTNADPVDLYILQAECDKRDKGETPIELAQLQLQLESAFATACSVIDGMVSSAERAIDAVENVEDIQPLLETLRNTATQELQSLLAAIQAG